MSAEDDAVQRALLAAAVEQIKTDNVRLENEFRVEVAAMEQRFEKYVEKALFDAHKDTLEQRIKPLELIVKGMVALVLMGVGTAILNLVVNGGS
jgi:hypothetical protein